MRTREAALAAAVLMGLGGLACQKGDTPEAASSPAAGELSEEQKTMYALGAMLGRNVQALKLSDAQLDQVVAGLRDGAKGAPLKADPAEYGMQIQQLAQARQLEAAQAEKDRGQSYAETAEKEDGAVKLPSGVVYRTLKAGSGASPKATDVVRVHYQGTFVDGKEFDSSVRRGQPVEFALDGVIPCWTEGVQRMKVGEKASLVCPSDTAYGDQGRGPQMPGGATLVFEVELLEIRSPKRAEGGK